MTGTRAMSRRIFSLALVAAACSPVLAACGRDGETQASPPPRPVRTATIEKREASTPLTFTGHIESDDEVSIAFRISGRLLESPAKIGDRIEIIQTQTGLRIELAESQNGQEFFAMASSP